MKTGHDVQGRVPLILSVKSTESGVERIHKNIASVVKKMGWRLKGLGENGIETAMKIRQQRAAEKELADAEEEKRQSLKLECSSRGSKENIAVVRSKSEKNTADVVANAVPALPYVGYIKYDIGWLNRIEEDHYKHLRKTQKINSIPLMDQIYNKRLMALNLRRLSAKFPEEFRFAPQTWCIPRDRFKLLEYCNECKEHPVFIVKPSSMCRGVVCISLAVVFVILDGVAVFYLFFNVCCSSSVCYVLPFASLRVCLFFLSVFPSCISNLSYIRKSYLVLLYFSLFADKSTALFIFTAPLPLTGYLFDI